MKKTVIAAATAAAIGLGTFATTGPALAAPAFPAMALETASAVELAGGRHKHRRYRKGAHVEFHFGYPRIKYGRVYKRPCYWKRVRVWSPRLHGYVWREKKVCRYW